MRLWLVALTIQSLLLIVICGRAPQNRRSSIQQANLPSKGGWRPVFGSSGLSYSPLGTAPLHAPSYKIPLLDLYPSSVRPVTARDVTKLTSIAQSYKPTTLRTVSVSTQRLPVNQPINSYLNPFSLPNNGGNHYKFVQSYPVDSIFLRNQYNSYAARPVLQKQQTKQNQNHQYHNNILQQLSNIQPIQFGQYSTGKPIDIFGKPKDAYPRQDGKRPQSAETEIFKPEVFKLGDADTPSQFLSQSVKTAQQQSYTPSKYPINQYGHPFQDTVFPPSILGSFGSFGIQSVKGRDPVYPTTKTTFLPPQSTKQTVFNSFNYSPSFKSTPALFATSTPKLTTAQNYNYFYSSTLNDLGNVPTPQTKLVSPIKIDPNAGTKYSFKPSPQDPFVKNFQNIDYNKISTYSPPVIQTSSAGPLYNDYGLLPQNTVFQGYKNQNIGNIRYDKPKQKVPDNLGLTQQVSQQYTNAPGVFDLESSLNALSQAHRPSYAVVENTEDVTQHASATPWTVTPQSYAHNQNSNEPVTSSEHIDNIFEKPTTVLPDISDEYSIVTESENNNRNLHYYDSQVDTQSRRPLGDDFEPIGKNKLRDYYYKVSTPTYTEHKPYRRTKKPTEASKPETTTFSYAVRETTEVPVETLPTLPPNRHFKRPSTPEPLEKDKIRKRNKIRRRRPSANRNREETSTRKEASSTEIPTTITEDIHTVRPRVRPIKLRTEPTVTTPNDTTESTTGALPTTSPTKPTVIKKKLVSLRRPSTTPSDRFETTTQVSNEKDNNRESPIMKISSRPQLSKAPLSSYEFKNSEIPDYSHKQDEKDTPTSDVAVSIGDTLKTTDTLKEFSFHRDVRPVEIKEVTTQSLNQKMDYEITSYAPRTEASTRPAGKVQRPRLKNKFDRPKFSVKDYRNRLNSTTSTTEKVTENTPKARPQRKNPYTESIFTDIETTTERKKFTPKEPRHKLNRTENNEQEIHSRQSLRQKQNSEGVEASTQRMSSRIRNGQRRPRPTAAAEENSETSTPTVHNKRPLRKRIHDSETGESVQDISVTETSDHKNDMTEKTKSESAIMKIADKKHHDPIERLFEHSKRVSDLTLAASKDYNTPGMFKTVSSNSRRIPSYFTIATDDPILPIEAFFPQLNQKKES